MAELQVVYSRAPEVVAANVGTKSFLLHVNDWVYLELNDSGSYLWSLLDGESTLSDITRKSTQEFAVDAAVCSADAAEFLQTLEDRHFVQRA